MHHRFLLLKASWLLFSCSASAGDPAPQPSSYLPARPLGGLAAEDSVYLRSLAGSPVAWRAWGPEAFAEAGRTGRPVFVSIGYFTCHWTARMDREVFGDARTAAWLNAHCVNVKVDRFERPDLDRFFRRFAETTGQRAGWPLNLWVSPECLPLRVADSLSLTDTGAGSFPAEARHVVALWKTDAPHLRRQAGLALGELAAPRDPDAASAFVPDDALLTRAHGRILGEFDPVHGGFGRSPKFPASARLGFLARRLARSDPRERRAAETREVIETTLDRFARGGLHDHLAGGFFRYALDEAWLRPYFEKPAHDQALAAESFLLGHRLTGRDDFAAVARRTLDYALRDLGHPEGAFYNGEHCESRPQPGEPPREGAIYMWTLDEWRRGAGRAAAVMEAIYDIREGGNLPPGADPWASLAGANVPVEKRRPAELARRLGVPVSEVEALREAGHAGLLAARAQRPRPPLDRLLITQTNAALVSALCQGAHQLGEPAWLDRARLAATWLLENLWDAESGTLFRCRLDRTPHHPAVADDHAALVRALLDLHEATGEFRWLRYADDIQSAFDRLHGDTASGGYFDARHERDDIPAALKTIDDAAALSPNALAALNLARWSVLLESVAHRDAAGRLLACFAGPLRSVSGSVAGLLQAADAVAHPPARLVLLGPAGHPDLHAARRRLALCPPGRWHVLGVETEAARQWLISRGALPAAVAALPLDKPAFCAPSGDGSGFSHRPLDKLDKFLAENRSFWQVASGPGSDPARFQSSRE